MIAPKQQKPFVATEQLKKDFLNDVKVVKRVVHLKKRLRDVEVEIHNKTYDKDALGREFSAFQMVEQKFSKNQSDVAEQIQGFIHETKLQMDELQKKIIKLEEEKKALEDQIEQYEIYCSYRYPYRFSKEIWKSIKKPSWEEYIAMLLLTNTDTYFYDIPAPEEISAGNKENLSYAFSSGKFSEILKFA